jgi:trimethylamine--corrinoid protein Co-methyltransferase
MKHIQSNPTHPAIQVLSSEQVQAMHQASLQILEDTGIDLKEEKARHLLLAHGAYEGRRRRVHIPAHLVEQALASAPKRLPICNQDGELSMPMTLGEVYFGPGSDTIYTLDLETGERRYPVSDDVRRIAQLCDALPNIDFVMSMGTPVDVPPDDHYVHAFIQMMRGTRKPLVFTARDRRDMEHIWQIACAQAGGPEQFRQRPFLINYSEPISPLLFPVDPVEKLLFCAEVGIPAAFIPSTNLGGGGPVTVAGAVALGNAETLAGLVMAQLVQPGAPFLYGANTAAMDMRTMIVSYGSPEWCLGNAALTDMAQHYGLPVWGTGGATDSKLVDAQAGLEAMLSIYSAYLSRATLVHDVGYIEAGMTSSMEMIVMCNEIIEMVRVMVRGITLDRTSLALAAIDQVTTGSGFMADAHTLENWRKSLFIPQVIDRQRYDRWAAKSSPDTFQRANSLARKILSEHPGRTLRAEVEAVIARVLEERAA